MAKWLSGSFESVSGRLSSFTGQLSSFTKEVLKEGTEEIHDPATELRIASQRVKDLEMTADVQKEEWDRIKAENVEQRERAEAAELQIAAISKEYRDLLQQKLDDLTRMKQEMDELKEQRANLLELQAPTAVSPPPSSYTNAKDDALHFGDVLSEQMEINRLRGEVERLRVQSNRWKEVTENHQGETSTEESVKAENLRLSMELEAVKEELSLQVDRQQDYIAALQNAHAEKLKSLSSRYESDIAELQQAIQQLKDNELQSGDEGRLEELEARVGVERERVAFLETEKTELIVRLDSLEETIEKLKIERDGYRDRSSEGARTIGIDEVDADMKRKLEEKLDRTNADLLTQTEENALLQEKTIELRTTCDDLRRQLVATTTSLDERNNERNRLEKQLDDCQKNLKNSSDEFELLRQSRASDEVKFADEKIEMEKQLLRASEQSKFREEAFVALQRERDRLTTDRDELERRLGTANVRETSQFEELRRENERSVEAYEAQIVQLRSVAEEHERRHSARERDVEALRVEVSRLNGIVAEEREKSTSDLREKQLESSGLIDEMNREKEMLASLREHNGQLLEALTACKKRLATSDEERRRLDDELKAKEKEMRVLQAEIVVGSKTSQATVERSGRELERLRTHLIEVEDSHTKEAIRTRERETELLRQLSLAEERVRQMEEDADGKGRFVQSQLQNLQDQLHSVCVQRDGALSQLSVIQEDLKQKTTQLRNLQSVLEQFQAERDVQVEMATEKIKDEVKGKLDDLERTKEQVFVLQKELAEVTSAAEMSAALRAEIDACKVKEEKLKMEVLKMETSLRVAGKHIEEIKRAELDRVDKALVKNMLIGYLKGPQSSKDQSLRLLGTVLNFTEEEFAKVLPTKSGWLSSLWAGSSPKSPSAATLATLDGSFSEMFVQFLQEESKPKGSFKFTPPTTPSSPAARHFGKPLEESTPQPEPTSQPSQPVASESLKPWKSNAQPVNLAGASFQLVPTSTKPDSQALALENALGYQNSKT